MSDGGHLAILRRVAAMLEVLDIPYAVGGSVASTLLGEPRSTVDVDIAIRVEGHVARQLLDAAQAEFYVPVRSAVEAIERHTSFNLIAQSEGMKVDLFPLGDGLLDRRQIERRLRVPMPGGDWHVWVTSAEDLVLRKLDWYRKGGEVSDRQWRDVVGVLHIQAGRLDLDDLRATATELGLDRLLDAALHAPR